MPQGLRNLYGKIRKALAVQTSIFDRIVLDSGIRPSLKYGFTIIIVAISVILRSFLEPVLGGRHAFLLFYPAVILAALVGGTRAGLLATLLSGFIVDFFFMPGHAALLDFDLRHVLAIGIFCFNGVLITLVAERVRRARTEQAQVKGADTLRLAIESIDLGIFDVDLSKEGGEFSTWNSTDLQKHHLRPAAGRGMDPEESLPRLHPDDREGVEKVLQNALKRASGGSYSTEYRTIGAPPAATERWIAAWGRIFFDDHGRPARHVGATQDITERKRVEETLARTRDDLEKKVRERTVELQRQAHLLDLSQDAIFTRELTGRITFWNAGAEALYGWSREEALGKVSSELLRTEIPRPGQIRAHVLKMGKWEGELQQTRKDGRRLLVWTRITLRTDDEGKPIDMMATHTDRTKQWYLEQQLRQSQKMEAVGVLAGGVAHDFNNVLAVILGNAELALDDITDERPRYQVEQILKASMRARDVVKELLTFARRSDKEKKPVKLAALVDETVKFIRATLPSTIRIEVDVEVASDIIQADPVQIQQVLINLATNAADAMRQNGGELHLSLRNMNVSSGDVLPNQEMDPGPYVLLSVKDTGHGMDEAIMARMFEPFFSMKERGRGTGLGLSVVYGIVKSHKGAISVTSKPGDGSTFLIYLPAIEHTPTQEPEMANWSHLPGGKERILFVDDEEALLEVGRALLTKLGYEVVARRSGSAAFETFRADPEIFDVVITDQTMPDMTGLNLAAKLLDIKPRLPVILCTGYSESVCRDSASRAGIKEFLMKPLSKRELADAVRRSLAAGK